MQGTGRSQVVCAKKQVKCPIPNRGLQPHQSAVFPRACTAHLPLGKDYLSVLLYGFCSHKFSIAQWAVGRANLSALQSQGPHTGAHAPMGSHLFHLGSLFQVAASSSPAFLRSTALLLPPRNSDLDFPEHVSEPQGESTQMLLNQFF